MATLPLAHTGELESAATVVALTVLGFSYAAGCLELSRVGRSWPAARSFSFFIGLSVLGSALVIPSLLTGAGTSDFEIHAIQHLLVGMLAPVFFALSAPVTLVLACIGSVRVRRKIVGLLRARPIRVMAHPVVAATLYAGSMVLLYASPLYAWTLENSLLHGTVHVHMFLVGCLFCWALIAVDPVPRSPGLAVPIAALLIASATHAILSKALYAGGLEAAAVIPADQREAGAMLMFYGGDLIELTLVTVFFAQLFAKRARRRRWRDRIEGRQLGGLA